MCMYIYGYAIHILWALSPYTIERGGITGSAHTFAGGVYTHRHTFSAFDRGAVQVPGQSTAAQGRPRIPLLHTGADARIAHQLASSLLRHPELSASRLLAAQSHLEDFQHDFGSANSSQVIIPAQLFSLLGLTLGSSSAMSSGLYVEPALTEVRMHTHSV